VINGVGKPDFGGDDDNGDRVGLIAFLLQNTSNQSKGYAQGTGNGRGCETCLKRRLNEVDLAFGDLLDRLVQTTHSIELLLPKHRRATRNLGSNGVV
jgi:hypothetical protein